MFKFQVHSKSMILTTSLIDFPQAKASPQILLDIIRFCKISDQNTDKVFVEFSVYDEFTYFTIPV